MLSTGNPIMPRIIIISALRSSAKICFTFSFEASVDTAFKTAGNEKITSEPAVLESLQFKSSLAEIRGLQSRIRVHRSIIPSFRISFEERRN